MGAGVIVPVLAGVVAIVTLTVTSDDAGSTADRPTTASNGTADAVVIQDFAYSPTITVEEPGTYAYCDIHDYMTGVSPPGSSAW